MIKFILVPFGEYVPFERYFPSFREHIDKPIGSFAKGKEYDIFNMKNPAEKKFLTNEIINETNFFKFGVLICFEDIFSDISRKFVNEGAQFLITITNDAWFGKTSAAYQHMISSVFRAVENKVSVIRCANTGVSCSINAFGEITEILGKEDQTLFIRESNVLSIVVPSYKRKTIYTKYGDCFVLFCLIFFIVFLIVDKKTQARLDDR